MTRPLLIVAFGGPEGPDEVLPFLRRVTAGRGIPDARLAEVGAHYAHFGGVSPLPGEVRALAAEVGASYGFLHSSPTIAEAVAALDGPADVLVASAFGSGPSCARYVDAVVAACPPPGTVRLPLIDAWEGFAEAWRAVLPAEGRLVFTAHSLPVAAAARTPYVARIEAACAAIGREREWTLAWQSRSGPPHQAWLEPDVGEVVRDGDVVVPVGFPLHNVEIGWDLETEAADVAAITVVRPPPLGAIARAAAAADARLPLACSPDCCRSGT